MPHTHEFDCKICGEHIDSQKDLDRHNRDQHEQSAKYGIESSPDASGSTPSSRDGKSSDNGRGLN